MITLLKVLYLCVQLVLLLIPALKCLPRPSIAELRTVAKLLWPIVRKLRGGKVDLASVKAILEKLVTWLREHQSLVVRIATVTKNIVVFVKRLLDVLLGVIGKVVHTVVRTVKAVCTSVWSALNTKLF